MTHMLHREGTLANLADDYPMLAIRARGYNHDGNVWRLKKILEIASRYPIVNFGDVRNGCKFTTNLEQIFASDLDLPLVHMVFTNKEDLTRCMADLKAKDLGISVVASGVMEEIFQCCGKAGLRPHTVNYSLGVRGRTEKLPPKELLEITTMCGHALVATNQVKKLIEDIQKGRETSDRAAAKLAKNCVCGIFNSERASKLLQLAAGV
jgi:hypothetical protein